MDRYDRVDCEGLDQGSCEGLDCCWDPLEEGSAEPWCFFPGDSEQVGQRERERERERERARRDF